MMFIGTVVCLYRENPVILRNRATYLWKLVTLLCVPCPLKHKQANSHHRPDQSHLLTWLKLMERWKILQNVLAIQD